MEPIPSGGGERSSNAGGWTRWHYRPLPTQLFHDSKSSEEAKLLRKRKGRHHTLSTPKSKPQLEITRHAPPRYGFSYATSAPHLVLCVASPSRCSNYSGPPQSASPGTANGHSSLHTAGRCNCDTAPLRPYNTAHQD